MLTLTRAFGAESYGVTVTLVHWRSGEVSVVGSAQGARMTASTSSTFDYPDMDGVGEAALIQGF